MKFSGFNHPLNNPAEMLQNQMTKTQLSVFPMQSIPWLLNEQFHYNFDLWIGVFYNVNKTEKKPTSD